MTSKVTFRLDDSQAGDLPDSINEVKNGKLETPLGYRVGSSMTVGNLQKYMHGDLFNARNAQYIFLDNQEFEATLILRTDEAKSGRWVFEDIYTGTTFRMYSRYFFELMASIPVQLETPIAGIWTCTIHGSTIGVKLLESRS